MTPLPSEPRVSGSDVDGAAIEERRACRVVHLSSVHREDDRRIFHKECRSLARTGYNVQFIVPSRSRTRRDGVAIVPLKRRGSRRARMVLSTVDSLVAALGSHASLYHFHDPELIPVGLILRLFGKRVIYDVHEDLPRSILEKTWIPAPLRPFAAFGAGCVEWLAGRALSGIVAATPTIARRFPARCTALVQNFPLRSEFASLRDRSPSVPPTAVYVGGISRLRGAREMTAAIGRVTRFGSSRLILAGKAETASFLKELENAPGWDRVDYLGWQPPTALASILARASVGLVLLHPAPNYVEAQPTKLYEYLAAGLPVIASDFPLWRAFVVENGCGLCVPPLDVDAIAAAMEWVFAHPSEAREMGQRGRALVCRDLNWEKEEEALLALYSRLVGTLHRDMASAF